jgi:hypothetical protein
MPTAAKLKLSPLPPELRALCGRLAVERVRAQQWALAAELRQQQRTRLAAGEHPDVLVDELRQAIAATAARPG